MANRDGDGAVLRIGHLTAMEQLNFSVSSLGGTRAATPEGLVVPLLFNRPDENILMGELPLPDSPRPRAQLMWSAP